MSGAAVVTPFKGLQAPHIPSLGDNYWCLERDSTVSGKLPMSGRKLKLLCPLILAPNFL